MQSIILAIGNKTVETVIESALPQTHQIVGVAPYKEAVLSKLDECPHANILLIRDNLKGSMKFLELIHQVRIHHPDCRIVLMTKKREVGDPFLHAIIGYGVYNIILGYKVSIDYIIEHLERAHQFKDVERYQQRITFDETTSTPDVPEPDEETKDTPKVKPVSSQPEEASSSNFTGPMFKGLPTSSSKKTRDIPASWKLEEEQTNNIETLSQRDDTEDEDYLFDLNATLPAPFEEDEEAFEPLPVPISNPSLPAAEAFPAQANEELETPAMELKPQAPTRSKFIPTVPLPTAPAKSPKILSTDDIKEIKKPPVKTRRAYKDEIKNSPIVMSLVGFKSGTGTSQVAFNLAVELAQKNNRVLYVELNDHSLPFTYLYQLGSLNEGLEHALKASVDEDSHSINGYVQRLHSLKQSTQDKELQKLYHAYPDHLDFLSFSHFFSLGNQGDYRPEGLKNLLMALLLSEGYQYIVLDVNIHSNPVLVDQALRSSKYILPVIQQDMLSIAQTTESLKKLTTKGISTEKKVYLVTNRYDSACFSDRSIVRWMNNELPHKVMGIWSVPEAAASFNKANDNSLPVLLASPPKPIRLAFEAMHNHLKTM